MGDQFLAPKSASAETTGDVVEEQLPVYAGKWTQEEEQYAQFLMEEFRSGNIPGLENGASMRNYLAKMLICRPKRVTKKYERTGYNGKLTYQANQVRMAHQQAQERRQQLATLRAKFLESRKQRLCLVMPSSLNPPSAPAHSSAAASAPSLTGSVGNAQVTLMGALEAPSSLLGDNNFPLGLSGATQMPSSALLNYGGLGASVGQSVLANQATRNNMSAYSLFGAGVSSAPTGSAGSFSSPLMRGMAGLTNQSSGITISLLASMQNMQNTPLLQQQRPASLLLPNERLAPGSANFSLTQQTLLAQLQRENEQRANLQELVTRQNLMAGLQMEQERKLALQQALNDQYQRNTGTASGWQQAMGITSEAAAAGSHGSAFEGQHQDLGGRAGLKRDTADEPDDGLMRQWNKKPRGF